MLGFATMSRQSVGRAAILRRRPPRHRGVLPVALRAVAITLMIASLAACGIKGPLRPPPKAPSAQTPSTTTNPATPPPTTSPALPPPNGPQQR
jgi:predicted small lipoprotein YifL